MARAKNDMRTISEAGSWPAMAVDAGGVRDEPKPQADDVNDEDATSEEDEDLDDEDLDEDEFDDDDVDTEDEDGEEDTDEAVE